MADETISTLTAAAALVGTEVMPGEQVGAADTVKISTQQILDFFNKTTLAPESVTTSSYTFVLADMNKTKEANNATLLIPYIIPPHSSVAFPIGATIIVRMMSTGVPQAQAGSGVTLIAPRGAKIALLGGEMAIQQTSIIDTWVVTGDTIV